MGYTLTDTVITALLSFFLSRCPILPLMVNTPIYHPASVNVPLLFPLCYRNYDLTVNDFKKSQNLPNNRYVVCFETQIWAQSAMCQSYFF